MKGMARKKLKDGTKLQEFLRQRLDLRKAEDRNVWKAVKHYYKTNNTKKLSLLGGLAERFPRKALREVLNFDLVDYRRDIPTYVNCVCGQPIKHKVYRMRLVGRAAKGGVESKVVVGIKDGVLLSSFSRKDQTEFFLGNDCYLKFPDIFRKTGIIARKKKRKKPVEQLEAVVSRASKKIERRLRKSGIDPARFQEIFGLIRDSYVTEESLLMELTGRSGNMRNWFSRAKRDGVIDDDIAQIYEKLRDKPHLIQAEEIAWLNLAYWEERLIDTDAAVGGIRDDLLYLDSSIGDAITAGILKKYCEQNINRHYVRPDPRLEPRQVEDISVKELLARSHVTWIDVAGIKKHFPQISEIRREANLRFAERYAHGTAWHYFLEEIEPVFNEVRRQVRDEKKFRQTVSEKVLTDSEYRTAKLFFDVASKGKRSARENYLRLFSIKEFRQYAPVMISIGRKIRLARGASEIDEEVMKKEYCLQEDVDTCIDEGLDSVVDMLVNARFIGNENFNKWQQKNAKALKEMYDNGLVAKEFLRKKGKKNENDIQRYYGILKKEGVRELKDTALLDEIINCPYIRYEGRDLKEIRDAKYASKKTIDFLGMLCRDYRDLMRCAGDTSSCKENLDALKKYGKVLVLSNGPGLFAKRKYDINSIAVRPFALSKKKLPFKMMIYDTAALAQAAYAINNYEMADDKWMKKLEEVTGEHNLGLGMEKPNEQLWPGEYDKDTKVFVSQPVKQKVEELYERLQECSKSDLWKSVEARREQWKSLRYDEQKKAGMGLLYEIYARLVKPDVLEFINGTCDGPTVMDSQGRKRLKRLRQYHSNAGQWAVLTFRRFMRNGIGAADGTGLASGADAEFRIDDNVRQFLEDDRSRLTEEQYQKYKTGIEQFEKDVNKLIHDKYSG